MKITVLGACSGTEPIIGYRHVSFTIERNNNLYWFDAGEGCSYTAHTLGKDLLSTKAIFITHTHMDHIGGLANLLWNLRKINGINQDLSRKLTGKTIEVFIPNLITWQAILQILANTEGRFGIDFNLQGVKVGDGLIYNKDGFKVIALHNRHLIDDKINDWLSFSFRIETEDNNIVYTGDFCNFEEITPLLNKCDLLLVETGHHRVEDICKSILELKGSIKTVGFIHHGLEILADPSACLKKAQEILGDRVYLFKDKTEFYL